MRSIYGVTFYDSAGKKILATCVKLPSAEAALAYAVMVLSNPTNKTYATCEIVQLTA